MYVPDTSSSCSSEWLSSMWTQKPSNWRANCDSGIYTGFQAEEIVN